MCVTIFYWVGELVYGSIYVRIFYWVCTGLKGVRDKKTFAHFVWTIFTKGVPIPGSRNPGHFFGIVIPGLRGRDPGIEGQHHLFFIIYELTQRLIIVRQRSFYARINF
jgi:hypothetical protein